MMDSTLRILEVGPGCLFKRLQPESTTWLCLDPWVETRASALKTVPEYWSPPKAVKARELLRRGFYDLMVCFAYDLYRGHRLARTVGRWKNRWLGARRDPDWIYRELLRAARDIPVAAVEMSDYGVLQAQNVQLLAGAVVYFKREWPADKLKLLSPPGTLRALERASRPEGIHSLLSRLRPISVGVSRLRQSLIPAEPGPKIRDVFFAGTVNLAVRRRGLAQLARLREEGLKVDLASGLHPREYMERCSGAWLAWSPPGLGQDCFRHYEAALCGSVPIIARSSMVRYHPLLEGEQAFYYDVQGDDLLRVIREGLRDKRRLARMAESARAHVLAHHTHVALGRYILSQVLPGRGPSRSRS
jgi:hypothetical protein